MLDRRFSLETLFISGWIVFFGSAIFQAILHTNHSNISGLSMKPLFHIIDFMPYLGLLFVVLPVLLFLKDSLRKADN